MPDFGSVHKTSQRDNVHLTSPNESYNISWEDAEKLQAYLKTLNVQLDNIVAIDTVGNPFEKKWVMENGWNMTEPLYLKGDTRVKNGEQETDVIGHSLATLASNISTNPRWAFERLLNSHGIVGNDVASYYLQFTKVQDAINSLF